MSKKKLRNRILATSLALCFTASALPLSSSAVVNAAQVEDNSVVATGVSHILSAGNNCDISKELIMPGESFRIEPQYDVFHTVGYYGQDVTNCWLYNASLTPGDVSVVSKLVRNTADVSGIKESRTDTYNVFKMAYERGDLNGVLEQIEDPERRAKLKQALQNASETPVTTGYVNNTNTPIVLQQVRTTSSKSEGVIYGGMGDIIPLAEAGSSHKSNFTIKFYEPYYTISYDDLLEGEDVGLPDRYYIKPEGQTITLPNLVRPGYHFDRWDGGMYFADREKVGDTTVLTFDWDNNLVNASYNFGDEILFPVFDNGYTVTFNSRGGTIDGEESAIYELDTESESFFDIGDYVPEREGYTFLGWCYEPTALYDSLIEDTSNYDWMNNTSGYDIQLYAKWAEDSGDKELELNGFRLDEETGQLTIVSDKGVEGWNSLCNSTNNECKAKVKSAFVGGDLTAVPEYIFSECENLKSVELSKNIKDISGYAFESCSSLEAIKMPGVTSIGEGAFYACTSLKTIEMPMVKAIGSSAFDECTSLKMIEMPSVESIESYAFFGCSSLEAVTIPPQTEYIGYMAFCQCSQLREVVFERTDYDENEDYFSVSGSVFNECHPDLYVLVQPSMLNLFKETFIPEYADIITDGVLVREITDVSINNAPTSCTVGEVPTAMAAKGDSGAYTFYEYWEEWAETENGLEPVKFWYSDARQMSRVPENQKITAFEEGKTYSYSIMAQANENYTFASKDALSVMLNGEDFTAKSEVILDGKSLMIGPGAFMTPTKPVEQKEIVAVEINNAPTSCTVGEAPTAMATKGDDEAYTFYEYWEEWAETENGLEPVKFWYSDAEQMNRVPADKRITTFEEGKTYSYSIIAEANENYTFASKDALSVMLNGEDYTDKSEVILDGKGLIIGPGAFMKPTKPSTQKEIELIEIDDATISIWAGDEPVFTGTTPDGAPYVIEYEGWFGDDGEFICSSDYWNSAYVERGWCDGLISTFKKNTEYTYQLYLKLTDEAAAQGYVFGPDTQLSVNGEIVEYPHSGETGVALQIATNLTMVASTKYVPQNEIPVVEINNATLTFKDGDMPVFTGTTPNDAPYALVFEEWRTDGEWTRSDEWFNDAEHHGDDKDITAFDKNKSYNYNLYIKVNEKGIDEGWYFGPNTKLKINGKEVSFTNDYPDEIQIFGVKTGITMTPTTSHGEKILGDVDGNGELNINDVAVMQLQLAKLYTETFDESVADFNGDGEFNIQDASQIQLALAHLV